MKKLIIFGATGTVGKHVLNQALSAGYLVTAFCRNTSNIEQTQNPHLKIVEGDVYEPRQVNEALSGHDVVIIVLGAGNSRKGTVRSVGTKNIIDGMKKNGIKRLICQTTLGAGDSYHFLNFYWRRIMFGWLLKQVFLDHQLQEEYVKNSGLDWTIIRPGAFTDGKLTGDYQHGFAEKDQKLKLKISRADVADFILKQVRTEEYLYKTPSLSY